MTLEPIEVSARFSTDGEIIPICFNWQGLEYPVVSTGRRWQDAKGRHMLVMVPDNEVLELVFISDKMLWYLNLPRNYSSAARG